MKFIFSFFLAVIFLSPVWATVTETCPTTAPEGTQLSDYCKQTPGCKWSMGSCTPCQSGYYNDGTFTDGCHACDNGFDTGWSDLHKQHPAGASSCADWECVSGYNLVNIAGVETCQLCDPADLYPHAEFVNSNAEGCAQQCSQGYYGANANNCQECPTGSTTNGAGATNISHCTCQSKSNGISLLLIQITGNQYYCGQCGDGINSNTNPTTCTCFHGANVIDGNQTTQNIPIQCKCPLNTHTIDTTTNTCKCGNDYYLKNDNGTYTCAQCPTHSHHSLIGSEDVNDCICDSAYPTRVYDENNKLTGCTQCPDDNSVYDSDDNTCKCKKGYYNTSTDPNTVSCTECPAGSTTLNTATTPNGIGATTRSACTMDSSTRFCDGNGFCFNLLSQQVPADAN